VSDEISRSLGRVEGKLDSLIETIKVRNERDDDRSDSLEKRVGKVEAKQHWYSGAAATLGALFGLYMGKH
jgi:hypothetical protein